MVKKLKKRVTVKIEEDNVPEKSMTQGHENIEVEQQTNIEENEISKVEVKEIELVEATFHEELNQEVKENVKEHEQVPIIVQFEDEEKSLSDEARVHTEQDVQKQFEEEVMSRGIKIKVVHIASIKHQGKI